MPLTEQEQQFEAEPTLSRRNFLQQSVLGAAAASQVGIQDLFAEGKERKRQPTANDRLRRLPKFHTLQNGKQVMLDKVEVEGAKGLIGFVPLVHWDKKETFKGKDAAAVRAGGREAKEFIEFLASEHSVALLPSEGITPDNIGSWKRIIQQEDNKKLEMIYGFGSLVDLIKDGTVELIPTETKTAIAYAKKMKIEGKDKKNPYAPSWVRERVSLALITKQMKERETNIVISPWGPAHWKARNGELISPSVEWWNRMFPEFKLSMFRASLPTPREYLTKPENALPRVP